MSNRTFVAEYCGNQDYQHLVTYDKIDLHFYAVVENHSKFTCIPPDQAVEIFKEYGLTYCKFEKFTTKSLDDFSTQICNIYNSVE